MKFKLTNPDLLSYDLAKITLIADYFGYEFIYARKRKAILIKENSEIGFIQKDENGRIYILWKHGESAEYIDHILTIVRSFDTILVVDTKKAKKHAKWLLDLLCINPLQLMLCQR